MVLTWTFVTMSSTYRVPQRRTSLRTKALYTSFVSFCEHSYHGLLSAKKKHRLFETLLGRDALSSVVGVMISQFPAQVARPRSTDPTEVRFLRLLLSPPRLHFPAPSLLLHILSQLLPLRCIISKESYLFPCLDMKLPVLHTLSSPSALLCHTSLPSTLFRSSLPQIPSRTSLAT